MLRERIKKLRAELSLIRGTMEEGVETVLEIRKKRRNQKNLKGKIRKLRAWKGRN